MDKPTRPDLDVYDLIEDPPDASDCERKNDQEDGDDNGKSEATDHRPKRPRRGSAPEIPKLSHESPMHQRIIDFLLSLIAPPVNASPQEIRRTLISLSMAIAGIYICLGIAFGLFSSIGLSGFAKATTVEEMQRESADFRVSLYGLGIREFHRLYCNTSNYEDQLALNNQLERLKVGYMKEVGVPYVLPACPEKH
jgi:hypothetical protein